MTLLPGDIDCPALVVVVGGGEGDGGGGVLGELYASSGLGLEVSCEESEVVIKSSADKSSGADKSRISFNCMYIK